MKKIKTLTLEDVKVETFEFKDNIEYHLDESNDMEIDKYCRYHSLKNQHPEIYKKIFIENNISPDDCSVIDFQSASEQSEELTEMGVVAPYCYVMVITNDDKIISMERKDRMETYYNYKVLLEMTYEGVEHILHDCTNAHTKDDLKEPEHFDQDFDVFANDAGFERYYFEDEAEDNEIESVYYLKKFELPIIGSCSAYLEMNEDKTFNLSLEISDKDVNGFVDVVSETLKNETDYNLLLATLEYLNLVDEDDINELEDFMEWYNGDGTPSCK